jgi:hypothetical protein
MFNHQLGLGFGLVLTVALFSGPSVAQQTPPAPESSIQLCGQYECVEDRPLTPAEAQASRSHPEYAQPQQVAATKPRPGTPSPDENPEAISPF